MSSVSIALQKTTTLVQKKGAIRGRFERFLFYIYKYEELFLYRYIVYEGLICGAELSRLDDDKSV